MEKIPEIIHPSWHEHLQPLFDDPKMNLIKTKLLPNCKFYPEAQYIFRVFEMPLDAIKVVVLGQDPYFNGTAIGYAFAVNEKTLTPKSLQIIFKEIDTSHAVQKLDAKTVVKSKTLEHWREQGVFLLNTALTVEIGNAGSHTGQWQWFTREVIKTISLHAKGAVWLLWGAKAQAFRDYIHHKYIVDKNMRESFEKEMPIGLVLADYNFILEAPHPAAGAYGNKVTFEGCNHFNLCNEILKRQKKSIINW